MSSNQYNSVLRNGLTRRLWFIISLAMLVPMGLALFSLWMWWRGKLFDTPWLLRLLVLSVLGPQFANQFGG